MLWDICLTRNLLCGKWVALSQVPCFNFVRRYTTAEGGNVTPEEIQSASGELDERTYRQEFEASFENQSHGVVYYAFSRSENLQEAKWREGETLCWSLD